VLKFLGFSYIGSQLIFFFIVWKVAVGGGMAYALGSNMDYAIGMLGNLT
jgi:hypothetical protein